MFTQCTHCKAVFRVTMKEITTAQGKLRCGECANTFDAMETLSNTLPSENLGDKLSSTQKSEAFAKRHHSNDDNKSDKPFFIRPLWISLVITLLVSLLLLQVLYTYRNWLAHQPLTASLTRNFCKITNCVITPQRQVNQIEILSKNVYGHPNDPNSLIVTASLKNLATHKQPYPLIEVSFLNKKEEIVALQRFRPDSYTKNKPGHEYFNPGETLTFRMKIMDPGSEAVRFQFRFL